LKTREGQFYNPRSPGDKYFAGGGSQGDIVDADSRPRGFGLYTDNAAGLPEAGKEEGKEKNGQDYQNINTGHIDPGLYSKDRF
jgi:hypothetical protein